MDPPANGPYESACLHRVSVLAPPQNATGNWVKVVQRLGEHCVDQNREPK